MADVVFNVPTFKMVVNTDGTPTGRTEEFFVNDPAVPLIDAGRLVYVDGATGNVLHADATNATKSNVHGVSLGSGNIGQKIVVALDGDYDVTVVGGGPLKAGEVLALSPVAGGGFCIREAEVLNPNFVTLAFIVVSSTRVRMILSPKTTSVQKGP